MAGLLYDSLHGKLMKLPDDVLVYPAHGAGSLCGRNISTQTSSTIGEQRRSNYAVQPIARDVFIKMMTADLPELPAYFAKDVEINRAGAPPLADVRPVALSPETVRAAAGTTLLDVRRDVGQLDPSRPTAAICAGGYRSSAATSLLERHRFADLVNVIGGTSAWIAAGHPVEKGGADECAEASPSPSRS